MVFALIAAADPQRGLLIWLIILVLKKVLLILLSSLEALQVVVVDVRMS
jgi:hypothetical protein